MAGDVRRVYVWDRVVRLCHILLIIGVISAYISHELDLMTWHMWNGYTIAAVLVLRIIWGFAGTENARFASFLTAPRRVWEYVTTWPQQAVPLGHNPLGGYAVLALLGALLVQVTTGLFSTSDEVAEGPFYQYISYDAGEWLTDMHEANFFYILLPLIALHIAAIIVYWRVKRANLVTPMITGYKKIS
ncbi:MAG: cytochrome b/b6 domain-containing protein [Bdellovibrionales bacterium]